MTLQMRLLVFIALTITASAGPGRDSDCVIPKPSTSALTDGARSTIPNSLEPAAEARFRSGVVPIETDSLARFGAALQQDVAETVLTTFRVRDGKEPDFLKTERQTWAAYVGQNLVNSKFHVLLRGTDFPFPEFLPGDDVKKVQIDRNAKHIGRRTAVDLGLVGDIKATIAALLPQVNDRTDSRFLEKHVA